MKRISKKLDVELMISMWLIILLMFFVANVHATQMVKTSVRINRYVVAVSANDGGSERPMLRYAESDAKSFVNVLKEMGGVQNQNVMLVKQPSVSSLKLEFEKLDKKISQEKSRGGRNEVLIFYSGHADEKGLRLAHETYSWKELRNRIDALNADVKIAVIDACGSGAITRAKGGVAVPAFMVDESSDMKGYAFITSSTQDEVSQESDRLKGSFFTHSLVSGLRGAGDISGDGRVTLSEAYQFAFNETLQKTEATMGGVQHPSRDMNLAGTGDIVMTDLNSTSALLELSNDIDGRLFLRNENGELVAELNKKNGHSMSLGLPAGKYSVRLENASIVKETKITLVNGKRVNVKDSSFENIKVEKTIFRGEIGEKVSCEDGNLVACSLDSLDHHGTSRTTFNLYDYEKEPRKGVQLGLFFTMANSYMLGTQMSLTANVVKKEMHGVQLSAVTNIAVNHFEGLQVSSTLNYAKSFNGLQLSSLSNIAIDKSKGVQIAPLNLSMESLNGQIGAVNYAEKTPIQISAINIASTGKTQIGAINVAKNTHTQVSAINVSNASEIQVGAVNIANKINRLQIGAINYGSSVKRQYGIINIAPFAEHTPIGLINVIGNGVWSLTGTFNEMAGNGAKLDLGTAFFYTSFELGRNFKEGKMFEHYDSWMMSGFGLGTHFGKYGSHFDLEYTFFRTKEHGGNFSFADDEGELIISIGKFSNYTYMQRVKFGGTYQLFTGLGLVGGISLNLLNRSEDDEMRYKPKTKLYANLGKGSKPWGRFWPGFYAGAVVGRF